MSVLEVVGSDIDNFFCPSCGAHDRERHLFLYLERLGLMQVFKGAAVLHFAPEKQLAKIIGASGPQHYVKADLFPGDPSIEKIDMLDIPYGAETFDVVLANHVLEHVSDDLKALSELRRVLKRGGTAILQTPFSARLMSTFFDSGINDDLSRRQLYGEENHMRLYGSDIFERFAAAGLKPDIRTHADTLPDVDSQRYGINPKEPLFLFVKL
jgi:SAM-dependent methyltransferase